MEKLELLKQMAKGLALQFGHDTEIVIHDINHLGTADTIVHIENGHISNRQVGDGPTHPVLEASKHGKMLGDRYAYLTKTKDGRVFKSTTMYIRSDDEEAIDYIFCINTDITYLTEMMQRMNRFVYGDDSYVVEDKREPEEITKNVNDLMDDLLKQCERRIGKEALRMTKPERMEAIRFLNDAGVFLISKSMDYVADYFGISKYTVYNYMNADEDKGE